MIDQMVIRELYDHSSEEHCEFCVEREVLAFHGYMDAHDDLSQNEFFFRACEFLEEMEDLDTDLAKIDIWY